MEKDKYMKFFMIFVSVALVFSLMINFKLLSKVDQIANRVDSVSNIQQNMINNINAQTGEVRNVLNEFKEEQSWISRIERSHVDETEQGKLALTYSWQVKELQPGSEVVFHYSNDHSKEFTSLLAEEIQQGLFQVTVSLDMDMEPQWELRRYMVNRNGQPHATEKAKPEKPSQPPFRYYVSVTTDDMVRSGDIQTEQLEYLGTRYYGNINTDIRVDEKNLGITLIYHRPYSSTQTIEKVYLLTYENQTRIEEQEIEGDQHRSDNLLQFFQSERLERNDLIRHVIRVVYSDGNAFEKEI